ncbi:hypothetical protein JQC91_02670 [Jannaschia sp. Os4]|nr:hypothetical protein [Jannaschia sp. Os4]
MLLKEIEEELKRVEERLRELSAERAALMRLRSRAQLYPTVSIRTRRRSSLDRAISEDQILAVLTTAGRPLRSSEIYKRLRSTSLAIKEPTFRSHLTRMHRKGIVSSDGNRPALWTVNPTS